MFTVITSVKNGEKYLAECIESVLLQETTSLIQYIVVDGGSTDGSCEIIEGFYSKIEQGKYGSNISFEFIKANDNSMYDGLAKGFSKATGEWMLYINADDWLWPGSLKAVSDLSAKYPEVKWIMGYPNQINREGKGIYRKLPWRIVSELVVKGYYGRELPFIQQESCVWHRSLMNEVDLEYWAKFKYAGDQYLWHQFARKTTLHIFPELLGTHRTHGDQLSHHFREEYFKEYDNISTFSSANIPKRKVTVWVEKVLWLIPDRIKKVLNVQYLSLKGK